MRRPDRRDRQAVAALEHHHVGQPGHGAQFGQAKQARLAKCLRLEQQPAWIVGLRAWVVVWQVGVKLRRVDLRARGDASDANDAQLGAA
jgi:hypothetical protein